MDAVAQLPSSTAVAEPGLGARNSDRATMPFASGVDERPSLDPLRPVLHSKQYRIDRLIGEGGMGRVYKAYDPMLERDVAVKVLKPGLPGRARQRFIDEARHGARLLHPNLVRIYDLGVLPESGLDWFAMEYLVGRDLEDLTWRATRQGKRLPARLVVVAFDRILSALEHVHDRGLVHRDVKPGNIFITRETGGRRFGVKLLDLGVAMRMSSDEPVELCGDPRYCAPEQALGEPSLDHRADLYAAGISLFETLTGRHPFGDDVEAPAEELLRMQIDRPIPSVEPWLPRAWPASVRATVSVVIAKACAKDPADRFENAAVMKRALTEAFEP